ncbi:hypothetical protein GPECTOR_17g852 [Gonium pectorale]|uniref:Phospholipid/glycerol acyltransferase domain-containing protein n=1 Tax=Gonium pectorale TaxID=33097 RepID=A0A150GKG8_GONPE|nr:hypothetical protein GPECTOR_17g852 [Gonium pectorale]|eukprot:KXZ50215.1 hypothetical protein GPECTOR_17g852 [Gonium pectorale]
MYGNRTGRVACVHKYGGVRLTRASGTLPFLLYLPDIDGDGITSKNQWDAWSERFEMYAVTLDEQCSCSFGDLSSAVGEWLGGVLAGTPPERPVYLLGEGFGAVLALQLAWDSRRLVNRLILVNPATSYATSPLARITPLLERVPPALLTARLPAPPSLPQFPFPLPLPPPSALPLALAPVLGMSPPALLRQMADSISSQQPGEAVQALNRALEQVEQIASRISPASLLHRLKMLEEGIRVVSPRLARIPQRTMILAGGQDVALGSEKEAERLVETMERAFKRVLPGSGHALLHEPGNDLLSLLEAEGFYTTRRSFSSPVRPGADVNVFGSAGPVELPNEQEVNRYAAAWTSRLRELNSPVFISTLPDGTRVEGLAGLPSRRHRISQGAPSHHQPSEEHLAPSEVVDGLAALGDGPLLFVGNHQLYAFDMSVMVEEVLRERGILMRGLAHPGLFPASGDGEGDGGAEEGTPGPSHVKSGSRSGDSNSGGGGGGAGGGAGDDRVAPAFMGNMFQSFGAVRVTPTAMFRLLAAGEAVLLYPGGVREGFKRRNEKYELFWPSRSEFVRMAARFDATIIPVSAVGLEDSLSIVLDSDEMQRSPLWTARAREQMAAAPRARVGVAEDQSLDESFVPPLIAPAVPSRFYFLFGRPVPTSRALCKDRAAADQVYAHVKSEVEAGISYLLRKREQDPYADFLRRYLYEQNPPFGPRRKAPTFKL